MRDARRETRVPLRSLLLADLRVEDIWHDEMLYPSSGPTASANSL
jgi:hypothetical protein